MFLFSFIISADIKTKIENGGSYNDYPQGDPDIERGHGVGTYGYPSDPMLDRAKGYLLKGKVRSGIMNYGNFIDWDLFPAGLWGEYDYLPNVGFMAGTRGHRYSSEFEWEQLDMSVYEDWFSVYDGVLQVWCSEDLYDEWNLDPENLDATDYDEDGSTDFDERVNGDYVGMVFNVADDRGTIGDRKYDIAVYDSEADESSPNDPMMYFDDVNQWAFDFSSNPSRVCIATSGNVFELVDPNLSNAMLGPMYPWGMRPQFKQRTEDFDFYEFGTDGYGWTNDDEYAFYGSQTSESWFYWANNGENSDWNPSSRARQYTHDSDVNAGDMFGETIYTDNNDTYPVLAHSEYSQTWPESLNVETGEMEKYWPGWWAQDYNPDLPGCPADDRLDPRCWEEVPGRFTSDSDVFVQFDDRHAHRGNRINSNNEYIQTGYPLGLTVSSTAHSYGVSYAEDIMFTTVYVENNSDDMVMPDGTKLNDGEGFHYKDLAIGFYMDADVVSRDLSGSYAPHSNADDFMEFIDCETSTEDYPDGCPVINGQELRVSMAIIGDWDGVSGTPLGHSMNPDTPALGSDFGIVAVQMLDSPLATENVDLDQDGFDDIFVGEPLKMTDWHWFSWYNRPGVTHAESNTDCCAGDAGRDQALNKEEIAYKLMSGDTTNLSSDEHEWYFHADPELDLDDPNFNPHFDNIEDLKNTSFFQDGENGLDCVLMMTTAPFSLKQGERAPFSFCLIFGQNREDLLANAEFAQVMYNSRYQGFTPPTTPTVEAETGDGFIKLYWDTAADSSKDVVTGYADFEGYKVYKSRDGGATWGTESAKIFDTQGVHVGWDPVKQFDLTEVQDRCHCVKNTQIGGCEELGDEQRNYDVQGPDPISPWFSLGSNTGLPELECSDGECRYYWIDTDVYNGLEYTYSVTSYDMGVPYPEANPDEWARPDGYKFTESPRGTTRLDDNFVTVIAGKPAEFNECSDVIVVPNPYIARSGLDENVYERRIQFQNVPSEYVLKIYTVAGELVWEQDETYGGGYDGFAFWNLRTVNNQEAVPGLYYYTISNSDCKEIGKISIIR